MAYITGRRLYNEFRSRLQNYFTAKLPQFDDQSTNIKAIYENVASELNSWSNTTAVPLNEISDLVAQLPRDGQIKIYHRLYTLGCRVYQQ